MDVSLAMLGKRNAKSLKKCGDGIVLSEAEGKT
jgi:hypothetical protein